MEKKRKASRAVHTEDLNERVSETEIKIEIESRCPSRLTRSKQRLLPSASDLDLEYPRRLFQIPALLLPSNLHISPPPTTTCLLN